MKYNDYKLRIRSTADDIEKMMTIHNPRWWCLFYNEKDKVYDLLVRHRRILDIEGVFFRKRLDRISEYSQTLKMDKNLQLIDERGTLRTMTEQQKERQRTIRFAQLRPKLCDGVSDVNNVELKIEPRLEDFKTQYDEDCFK